jgi:DNA mismatch repair protein MutS
LAGLPGSVIQSAKNYLKDLESKSLIFNHPQKSLDFVSPINPPSPPADQSDSLSHWIQDLNLESLSPKDALDLLYKLKNEFKNNNKNQ